MTMLAAMLSAWGAFAAFVDLGVIDAHRQLDCSFAVTNTSAKVWKIEGARSSCACMQVSVAKGDLQPGEVRKVKVVFNPAGMEGPVFKSVQVDMRPGRNEVCMFKADVRLRLGLKPQDAAFGVLRRAETTRTMTVALAGFAATNVTITAIVAPTNPVFSVVRAPVAGTMSAPGLVVAFAERNLLPGTYAETWLVKTSDPEIPEIKFPVSARITDGISVSPQVIEINREGPACSRMVLLRPDASGAARAATNAFTVLAAETRPRKWADAKIVKRPLNGWQILLDHIDPAEVRQFSKKPYLEVKTDRPGMETMAIPLRLGD